MILSLALQVEHVLLFEFRVFSFGKICFILSLTQKKYRSGQKEVTNRIFTR